MDKNVGHLRPFVKFCGNRNTAPVPSASDDVDAWVDQLRKRKRKVTGQEHMPCTTVVSAFLAALSWAHELLNQLPAPRGDPVISGIRQAAIARTTPTAKLTRGVVTAGEYQATVQGLYATGRDYEYMVGFGIEMSVACDARYDDITHVDLRATVAWGSFRTGFIDEPAMLQQWRTETGFPALSEARDCWGVRFLKRKNMQGAPSWVFLGELHSPLWRRLNVFVSKFGIDGGILRKTDRRAKKGYTKGSTEHYVVSAFPGAPLHDRGKTGWRNIVRRAFRDYGGVEHWRVPDKGVSDVTCQTLRKLGASFMMAPFDLNTNEAHRVRIPRNVGAAHGGWRDLPTFEVTYFHPTRQLRLTACSRNQLGADLALGGNAAVAEEENAAATAIVAKALRAKRPRRGGRL